MDLTVAIILVAMVMIMALSNISLVFKMGKPVSDNVVSPGYWLAHLIVTAVYTFSIFYMLTKAF